ncbi:MAG: polysaccharide biosynthesis tyrosine autokinase [Caldilineaceae bacterium]
MALRQPVLQRVADSLQLAVSWRDLKKQVEPKTVEGAQLFQITAHADTPEDARAIADEVVHQLMLLRPEDHQNSAIPIDPEAAQQQLANLETKIALGRERLQTLESTSAASFEYQSIDQVSALQETIDTLKALLTTWESEYTQIVTNGDVTVQGSLLTVVEAAQIRLTPIFPRTKLNVALAAAVGLLSALGLVLLLEFRDTTLKSPDDVQHALGVPVLGAINKISGRAPQEKLLLAQDAASSATEAYRIIRSNLEFITTGQSIKTIVVTSPVSGEGKSTTVANLGIVMAYAGYRTIIVDADLRRPVQHQLFQIASSIGLTKAVESSEDALDSKLIDTKVHNLQVLTGGNPPINPAEFLSSQKMRKLLTNLGEMADVVIFDSPPLLGLSDAAILANRADGVLLVVEADQTDLEAARQAVAILHQANANLIGAILNRGRSALQLYAAANRRCCPRMRWRQYAHSAGIGYRFEKVLVNRPRQSRFVVGDSLLNAPRFIDAHSRAAKSCIWTSSGHRRQESPATPGSLAPLPARHLRMPDRHIVIDLLCPSR